MKLGSLIGLLVGLAAVSALVIWQGLAAVAETLQHAGWSLLLLCLLEPPNQLLWSESWRLLFPRRRRPGLLKTLWASWMGTAVNTLLPVATIGGEVVKARVLTLWSYSAIDTTSTMIVDKTVQAMALLVWGVIGIVMLAVIVPESGVVIGASIGAVALALGIAGFVAVQIFGGFSFAVHIAGKVVGAERLHGVSGMAARLDGAIKTIYRRPHLVLLSCTLLVITQLWMVGEVLLAAYLMGQPITLGPAIALRALVITLRGLSFAVPQGLGVQEGGYMAVGALFGLPAELMLAVSLATRIREVVPSVPFLIAWQHLEGRRALLRRRGEQAAEAGTNTRPPGSRQLARNADK